jgi:hypothetical protein
MRLNMCRGGRNFIPLEKKDFTKIIWGDQLNQTPEKTNANLKSLEEVKFPPKLGWKHTEKFLVVDGR